MPGAWFNMGGDISTSIVFVNDVTDKDGTSVDASGTTCNPNGTIETNNYKIMDMTDYFGTWVPTHYEGTVDVTKYTTLWQFGKGNGDGI